MEQENKLCPYCGKEIKSTAKKCIHCGKWLEKKCPACGEWVKVEANKCRYCGEWMGDYAKWKYEKATGIKVSDKGTGKEVIDKDTVKEMIEEQKDENNSGCLLQIECGVIVGLYAAYYDWEIWQCVLAFVVAAALTYIQFVRIILCIAFSVIWASFAYGFFDSWIAAIIGFVIAIGLHIPQFSNLKSNE